MKRLWGIRHARYFWLSRKLALHLYRCQSMGFGWFAQPSDIAYLDAVWKGES